MRAHCSFPVVRFPDPRVCFCVANGIKSFWHLLRVCMCVCVCSSFYALSPRSGGTHTHGAQHAIWLPCTRRSTRCGSFSMPISCCAYWMNRAPFETHRQRPDTQPKPQLSFRSAAATATAAFAATAAEVLFASLWRLAF